jgi:voltage-gated potassium channel
VADQPWPSPQPPEFFEPRRPVLTLLWHATLTLILLTLSYYVLPRHEPWRDTASLVLFLLALGLFAGCMLLLRGEMRLARNKLPPTLARVQLLLTLLYALILVFAVIYSFVAHYAPHQFDGIHTRTDALYFTVTTIATVGFGDIHAEQTLAKVLVTLQMLFDLVYLGTAFRFLSVREGGGSTS